MFSDRFFPIFVVVTVGGLIKLGAFYRIAHSIRFQAQREFSIEFEYVALETNHCQFGITSLVSHCETL